MRDETSLRRQWGLLNALSARRLGITINEMAREMGVTPKTIRRDLDLFRSVGFPLEESVGDFGRKSWKLANSGQHVPLGFSYDEALALHFGGVYLTPLAGSPFWSASRNALRKIRCALSSQVIAHFEQFAALVHHTRVGASDYRDKEDQLAAIQAGLEDQNAVRILYRSTRAAKAAFRDVHPYGIVYHDWSLYLIGYAPDDDKVKHYKVDRIEEAEVTKIAFKRPKDFNLEKHLASSFGIFHGEGDIRVKVRFAPAVRRYVQEGCWHPSQRLTPLRDGSLLAEFRLGCTEELKRWLLSFGSKAEVLEPESLRSELIAEIQALAATYITRRSTPDLQLQTIQS
jgi:predicted DNA-binding transcriptional regulator YafY